MDILKWRDKYSIDCRMKYNSQQTQNNYTIPIIEAVYIPVAETPPNRQV